MQLKVFKIVNENVRKDPDTSKKLLGDLQIGENAVALLKDIVNTHIQSGKDANDPDRLQLAKDLKDDFHEMNKALKPS